MPQAAAARNPRGRSVGASSNGIVSLALARLGSRGRDSKTARAGDGRRRRGAVDQRAREAAEGAPGCECGGEAADSGAASSGSPPTSCYGWRGPCCAGDPSRRSFGGSGAPFAERGADLQPAGQLGRHAVLHAAQRGRRVARSGDLLLAARARQDGVAGRQDGAAERSGDEGGSPALQVRHRDRHRSGARR